VKNNNNNKEKVQTSLVADEILVHTQGLAAEGGAGAMWRGEGGGRRVVKLSWV